MNVAKSKYSRKLKYSRKSLNQYNFRPKYYHWLEQIRDDQSLTPEQFQIAIALWGLGRVNAEYDEAAWYTRATFISIRRTLARLRELGGIL